MTLWAPSHYFIRHLGECRQQHQQEGIANRAVHVERAPIPIGDGTDPEFVQGHADQWAQSTAPADGLEQGAQVSLDRKSVV